MARSTFLNRALPRPQALTAIALVAGLTVGSIAFAGPAVAAAGCPTPSWDFDYDGTPDNVVSGLPWVTVHESASDRSGAAIAPEGSDSYLFGSSIASVSSYSAAGEEKYCALLAVGAPDETVDGHANAGAVYVFLYGRSSEFGSPTTLVRTITQGSDGVPGTPQTGARFGAALAAANHDDHHAHPTTLAIGAPGQTVGGKLNAGSVTTLTLPIDGPVQDARVVTTGRADAALGTVLAATDQLVVAGAPGTTVGGRVKAGSVLLVPNDSSKAAREITENNLGSPGGAETGDGLGKSIAVHWNARLNRTEIGLGMPLEDVGAKADAGTVTTMRADAAGVLSGFEFYSQSTAGVHGSVERGDMFGTSVSARPNPSGASAWYVGVPLENIGSAVDAGLVQTVGMPKNLQWSQNTAGVPGAVRTGNRMGKCLSSVLLGVGPVIGVPRGGSDFGAAFSGLPINGHTVTQYEVFEEQDSFGCPVGP